VARGLVFVRLNWQKVDFISSENEAAIRGNKAEFSGFLSPP
jgi:hypothetical protein